MNQKNFIKDGKGSRLGLIRSLKPAPLLLKYYGSTRASFPKGPVLDLACGRGHNGLYLAANGHSVILLDRSKESLNHARNLARQAGLEIQIICKDLEQPGTNPLVGLSLGTILVFRYLHRPIIPFIKGALRRGGLLIYETFTMDQARYGRPKNPDFLFKPNELKGWFSDWDIIHYFEGIMENPLRAVAQIICKKGLNRIS